MTTQTLTENEEIIDPIDRRIYKRLPTCYRIDFEIVRLHGNLPGFDWQVGSTQDVSRGGLCLDTKSLDRYVFKYLKDNNIYLDLRIYVPPLPVPIKAVGEVSWFKETRGQYTIGLQFRSITKTNLNFIINESWALEWLMAAALGASTLLFVSLIFWQLLVQLVNQ